MKTEGTLINPWGIELTANITVLCGVGMSYGKRWEYRKELIELYNDDFSRVDLKIDTDRKGNVIDPFKSGGFFRKMEWWTLITLKN